MSKEDWPGSGIPLEHIRQFHVSTPLRLSPPEAQHHLSQAVQELEARIVSFPVGFLYLLPDRQLVPLKGSKWRVGNGVWIRVGNGSTPEPGENWDGKVCGSYSRGGETSSV